MKNYLISFKSWLQNKKYNSTTIRNYLSDLNKYFEFAKNKNIFDEFIISSYISQISKENNFSRQLASLNKFCQFAIDQKLISFNPLKRTNNSSSLNSIIQQYQSFLFKKKFTPSTIKNYINDIQQYINFIKGVSSEN